MNTEERNQEICKQFVRRELGEQQFSLVDICRQHEIFTDNDIYNQWSRESQRANKLESERFTLLKQLEEDDCDIPNTLRQLDELDAEIGGLDATGDCEQEVLQWWTCTSWIAEKLIEKGEVVMDNNYGTWWGRSECGGEVYMDTVIRQICSSEGILVGQKYEWKV